MRSKMIGVVMGAFLPIVAGALTPWLDERETQRRLTGGEVVVRSAVDGKEARGHVEAAVRIQARPEAVWRVLTDYEHAASFIPGLKSCHRIGGAADGSWAVIQNEVKYAWYMPIIHSTFRAEYRRPWRIDFQRISGDLKDENGAWLLKSTPDGSATVVEYDLYIDPGFWIPPALVRQSLRSELPAALEALRTRVESQEPARP